MLRYLLLLLCVVSVEVYRTSMCLRMHEEFSLCGWRCPPTCVNLKLITSGHSLCSSIWECRMGCRCSPGFVRDEYSKNCVPVEDCPGNAKRSSGTVSVKLKLLELHYEKTESL